MTDIAPSPVHPASVHRPPAQVGGEYTVVSARGGPVICSVLPGGSLPPGAGPETLPMWAREEIMFRRRAWARREATAREWALPFSEPEPRGLTHPQALRALRDVQKTATPSTPVTRRELRRPGVLRGE